MTEPLLSAISSRPYHAGDRASCLQLFDGNTPAYFDPIERPDFVDFLDSLDPSVTPYLVLERDGRMIACGGLRRKGPQAHLLWGMVDRSLHRQGFGRQLTLARIALAREMPGITEVTLGTSQHSHAFYARLGFEVTQVIPQGFAPSMDRWDMALKL